jgi:hypothetical protein
MHAQHHQKSEFDMISTRGAKLTNRSPRATMSCTVLIILIPVDAMPFAKAAPVPDIQS